jgi:hypothetical protein
MNKNELYGSQKKKKKNELYGSDIVLVDQIVI